MLATVSFRTVSIALTLIALPATVSARPGQRSSVPANTTVPANATVSVTSTAVSNTKQPASPAPAVTPMVVPTNATLINPTVSQAFPAWQATTNYELKTGGGAQFYSNHARANSTVRYDAATGAYIVRETGDATKTYSLSAANKVGAESNATYTVYRTISGGTTNTFRLYNPVALTLTYASYGTWRQSTPGIGYQGATKVYDTYFVYGIKTAGADVPRSGTGNYSAVLDGTFVNKNGPYALSGNGAFTANWVAGTISYSATPVGTPTSGPVINFGTVGGNGTINFSNASFSGRNDRTINATYGMDLSGYFFGPAAAEIGAAFKLSGGGGTGSGVMIGKK